MKARRHGKTNRPPANSPLHHHCFRRVGPVTSRTILHVDMDAFYASVEQRECPAYIGKPVVVGADPKGGRGRGVVAACSYEARRFGIRSAMPISQAFRLCPHAVFLRPNPSLYSRVSQSILGIMRRYTDQVEPISIDEAFLDITGSLRLFGRPPKVAERIKRRILSKEGLTCSIGIASNKFVAKIASDLCKPNGLLQVAEGQEKRFLAPLSVDRMWGVGPKTEDQLHRLGVSRIGHVAARSESFWEQVLGRHGRHLWRLSQGRDDRPVAPTGSFRSLSQECTFRPRYPRSQSLDPDPAFSKRRTGSPYAAPPREEPEHRPEDSIRRLLHVHPAEKLGGAYRRQHGDPSGGAGITEPVLAIVPISPTSGCSCGPLSDSRRKSHRPVWIESPKTRPSQSRRGCNRLEIWRKKYPQGGFAGRTGGRRERLHVVFEEVARRRNWKRSQAGLATSGDGPFLPGIRKFPVGWIRDSRATERFCLRRAGLGKSCGDDRSVGRRVEKLPGWQERVRERPGTQLVGDRTLPLGRRWEYDHGAPLDPEPV